MRRAQSTLEYSILIAIVVVAIMTMKTYAQRAVHANLKMVEEQVNPKMDQEWVQAIEPVDIGEIPPVDDDDDDDEEESSGGWMEFCMGAGYDFNACADAVSCAAAYEVWSETTLTNCVSFAGGDWDDDWYY